MAATGRGLIGALVPAWVIAIPSAAAQEGFDACAVAALPARCGSVVVPENRARPGGRALTLRVIAVGASDSVRHADPIVLLLGGPGDGAASAAAAFAPPLTGLFEGRDIVFIDQRGTGDSNGLFCPGDRQREIADPASLFGSLFPTREVARCRDVLRETADLRHYLTVDAAHDLADVLDVLGYTEANLLGLSYGTRLAQEFARLFPERVRSLVLSGVMSFDIRAPLFYARDAQDALDLVLASCRSQAMCRSRYPHLDEDVALVWDVLDQGPVTVRREVRGHEGPVTLQLTKGDVGYAVRGMLYTTGGQEEVPAAFSAAAKGDWGTFADRYLQRRVRFFATGMHLSVLCSEEVRFLTDEDVASAVRGTFLGNHIVDDMRAACREWPAGTVPSAFHAPFTTPVPTLLISGEFDPVTPPRWAESVLASNPRAYHVVIPGGGHGITAVRGGPRCVGGIVIEFVSTAGTRAPSSGCLDATPEPEFRD